MESIRYNIGKKHYFYGWYYRCQGMEGTIAVIPSIHLSPSKSFCSIQIITKDGSFYREFPVKEFQFDDKKDIIKIGQNTFSKKGIRMKFKAFPIEVQSVIGTSEDGQNAIKNERNDVRVEAFLRFGKFSKPRYDIMGPFAFFSKMQCRHTVYSMKHTVDGFIKIDDRKMMFQNSMGYMEGDSGSSFPDRYIWTQHFIPKGSIMFAAATIPFLGIHFTGTIGYIFYDNREYRFATYLGASVKKMNHRELVIRQGHYKLIIRFSESEGMALHAPKNGLMSRKIIENISCNVGYTLLYKSRVITHIKTKKAAAEYDELFNRKSRSGMKSCGDL